MVLEPSLWISGVLDCVYCYGLRGLVGLPDYQFIHSGHVLLSIPACVILMALVSASCFPNLFSNVFSPFSFAVYSQKFRQNSPRAVFLDPY